MKRSSAGTGSRYPVLFSDDFCKFASKVQDMKKIVIIDGAPERIIAYNTYQVKSYDRFELASFSEPAKQLWRDLHWEADLQKAFDAGRRMAGY